MQGAAFWHLAWPFFLSLSKGLYGGFRSGCVLSSLIDLALDLMASAVTVYVVRHAVRPPDADHRFGHGKKLKLLPL